MAIDASNNRGIKRSWSLLSFVKEFGQPDYINDFVDKDGATFSALSFSADKFEDDQVRRFEKNGVMQKSAFVMVSFSQNLPADKATMEAINKGAENLQVVELQKDAEHPNASFKLCERGEFEHRGIRMSIGE